MPSVFEHDRAFVFHGDCLEEMKSLPDESIDAIVTDPPYGLAFMGKKWDHGVPGVPFWAEALRVAKPGAHLLAFGGTRTFHRLAVAIEDAGWEVRDCLSWLYGCLDESSEALTRTGWKRGVDLTPADEVFQWDSETGRLSWEHPAEVICKPYSGPMCRIKNRHTDQLLTPNHRVYAKIRRHSRHAVPEQYEVVEARDVSARSAAWQVTLPMAGVYGGTSTGPDASLAYLVGWWLTDAWKHGDGKAVMFSQAKPETLAKLRAALAPFAPSEYVKAAKKLAHNDEHTFYVTGEIAARLRKDFPDRKLTWDVLDWSVQARRGLFDGLMDGDGSQPNKQHTHTFWSKDAERRDVFLALCVSLGMRAYVGEKDCVFVSKKWDTTQVQAKHRPKPIQYEGMVWCVRVPSGAFVARRNGRPFITGNSGFPKSLDVSKAIDKAAGVEREVVGVNPNFRDPEKNAEHHARWNAMSGSGNLTVAATDAARQWSGWGTALKPAWEPVIVARKPLVGTVAANVQAHGTGALNIDGTRIATDESLNGGAYAKVGGRTESPSIHGGSGMNVPGKTVGAEFVQPPGRWPANVMLDEELDPVLCLRDSELEPLFRSVYAGFDSVHSVWRPVGGAAVAAQAVAVLHTALLRRVVEREQIGREPPHAREAAQRGSDREDVESTEGARVGGSESEHMEGRPVQVARVHDAGGVCVVPGGPRIGGSDGGARSRVRAGTSAGDGTAAGAPTTGRGGCASPERAQIGQQTGESGVDGRGGAQAGSRFGGGGTSASTGDDRRPAFCVAESDVPAVWREYFVESGRLIRTGSAAMLDAQTGDLGKSSGTQRTTSASWLGSRVKAEDKAIGFGDTGGASRFFYTSKASKKERLLPDGTQHTHPTTKPIKLMQWLVRLVTPPDGVVLDPFCGSGTTAVAALREGFSIVAIEREEQYVGWIKQRVEAELASPAESAEDNEDDTSPDEAAETP